MKPNCKQGRVWKLAGWLLFFSFVFFCGYDGFQYYTGAYEAASAPFYLYVVERALWFLPVSFVCFIVGAVRRRRARRALAARKRGPGLRKEDWD